MLTKNLAEKTFPLESCMHRRMVQVRAIPPALFQDHEFRGYDGCVYGKETLGRSVQF
jgi:hypothetical protein